jgi:hypothetical protein
MEPNLMVEHHDDGKITLLGSDGGKIKLSKRYWNNFLSVFTRRKLSGRSQSCRNSFSCVDSSASNLEHKSRKTGHQLVSKPILSK